MEWKIIVIVLLGLSTVLSVPIEEKKPKFLKFQNFDEPLDESFDLFYGQNKEFGNTEISALDDELNYRLPNDSIPLRYDLWLKTDVDKKLLPFEGKVKIWSKIIEPTSKITLHQRQLTIDNVNLYDGDNVLIAANLDHDYDATLEFMTITLPREMAVNDEVVLDISYHGVLREDSSGFYRSRYNRNDDPEQVVWFAMTQFEQTDARHAMPCYDEPGFRVIMSVSIQHDKSFNALSNMPIVDRSPVDGTDYVTSKFQDTPPMQTYLLAFIVSDYEYISDNEVDLPQRIYAKPQSIARGDADYALGIVRPVLKALEDHFGIPYPLPKMDHVAVTDYIWGAMEHYGLITYLEPRLLYNPLTAPSDSARKTTNEIIAHEYVHQWFGNLVNPAWWSYTWLNEGFARFFQYYILNNILPNEDYMDRLQNIAVESALNADKNPAAWSLNHYVQTPRDINSKFGSISYQKGASVIRMFNEALGEATFMKGLRYYLAEMYFKAATSKDLHRNLQKAYDEDNPGNTLNIDRIMTTWEDQAGYPVLKVRRAASGFTITQERYGGGEELYLIPLSYTTSKSPDFVTKTFKVVMETKEATIAETNPVWIILNVQQKGYYIARYEKSIWDEFSMALWSNHALIHYKNRVQLFRDALESIQEGLLEEYVGVDLMRYLEKETNWNVWSRAVSLQAFMDTKLFGTELFNHYHDYLLTLVQPHITRLGFEVKTGESSDDANLRSQLITTSCRALNYVCLNYELERLKNFIETGSGAYNLCNGMRLAETSVYETVIGSLLAQTTNARQSTIYLPGCSLNTAILNRFLDLSLDFTNNLSQAERLRIFTYTMGSSVTALETVLDFVKNNAALMSEQIPGSLLSIMSEMTKYIHSEAHATVFNSVLASAVEAGLINQENADSFTATVTNNLRWNEENLEIIEGILNRQLPTDEPPTDAPPTTIPTDPTTVPTGPTEPTTVPTNPTTVPTNPTTVPTNPTTPSTTSTTQGASTTVISFAAIVLCALIKFMA